MVQAANDVTCVGKVCEIERIRVVDHKEDLSFDTQLRRELAVLDEFATPVAEATIDEELVNADDRTRVANSLAAPRSTAS